MKANLIIDLISAHCSGNESSFKAAIEALAKDEERKGNVRISNMIYDAYKSKSSTLIKKPQIDQPPIGIIDQSVIKKSIIPPRDKDSLLELYDILYPDISLSDVVLPENQKRLLLQILAERKNNRKLIEHNLPSSNRLLFCGPPGCGKTVTAQAIAHELNLPMAYVRIDGLISSFLGQTSVNLRKVFSSVNDLNIVLFLDEFDSIAKKRDDGNEMGELKRVVTALLQNFDNMPSNVFLIAATNHEHLLDPAIWRRFNHIINIGYPNEAQRAELIYKWINEYSVKTDVDIQKITALTADCSAAQIKELVVSIAKRYVINNRAITMLDLIELLIQQMTNNSNGAGIVDAAAKLSTKGVSIRTLAKVIGIPHNTLNYQINKLLKGKEGD